MRARPGTAVLARDTSREAERRQVRIWRSLPPVELARLIAGASRAARILALAGLRERHPRADDATLIGELATLTIGPDLARHVRLDTENPSDRSLVTELLDVALTVTDALEAAGIRYTVGGSIASSMSGEPRASIDADILVEMTLDDVEPFAVSLGPDFYADPDAIRRAIRQGSSTNLVHRRSGIKVDLFVARPLLDMRQLQRRRRVQVASAPQRFMYVHSAEDILLQQLHWYKVGGEVSERQWRDVLSVVLVQGARLDRTYLAETAAQVRLDDLLTRAYQEAEGHA